MLAATLILTDFLSAVGHVQCRCWGLILLVREVMTIFNLLHKLSWAGGDDFLNTQGEKQYCPEITVTITCHDNNKQVLLMQQSALAQARYVRDCQAHCFISF